VTFAPLVYPHRPGMARWLTEWVTAFADATPGAVRTATLFPEPDVVGYLGAAVDAGARIAKVHVQVGGFDPRDPLLTPAWGLLADAGVPVVVHCGHGPRRGVHTGLDVFGSDFRTSRTPTPSRCAPSRVGRPRTTGSVSRSCGPSCTTPRPDSWAGDEVRTPASRGAATGG
jgi:amidohydrolase family protein